MLFYTPGLSTLCPVPDSQRKEVMGPIPGNGLVLSCTDAEGITFREAFRKNLVRLAKNGI